MDIMPHICKLVACKIEPRQARALFFIYFFVYFGFILGVARQCIYSFINSFHLDKTAADMADDNFKSFICIFDNENDRISIQISLKFAPRILLDNKPALIKLIAWRRTGDTPLSEAIQTRFAEAYVRR